MTLLKSHWGGTLWINLPLRDTLRRLIAFAYRKPTTMHDLIISGGRVIDPPQGIDGPAFDVLVTMSKFYCMDVPLPEAIKAVTENAARAISQPDLGTLKPGSPRDMTILSIEEGSFEYIDSLGTILTGDKNSMSKPLSSTAPPGPKRRNEV